MTFRNDSGIRPVEFKVLVKPDPIGEMTHGGIFIPEVTAEREGWAQVKGTLVAFGDSAFVDWSMEERSRLKPGARVYFSKYEGVLVKGADGEEYRLCTDKNIAALITAEGAFATGLQGRTPGALAKSAA